MASLLIEKGADVNRATKVSSWLYKPLMFYKATNWKYVQYCCKRFAFDTISY